MIPNLTTPRIALILILTIVACGRQETNPPVTPTSAHTAPSAAAGSSVPSQTPIPKSQIAISDDEPPIIVTHPTPSKPGIPGITLANPSAPSCIYQCP